MRAAHTWVLLGRARRGSPPRGWPRAHRQLQCSCAKAAVAVNARMKAAAGASTAFTLSIHASDSRDWDVDAKIGMSYGDGFGRLWVMVWDTTCSSRLDSGTMSLGE
ncbi:hypothetical protein SEVIR_1G174266v4 [Setaria viridis]